jgi:hypothetical protein
MRSPLPSILLLILYLTVGSAIGSFVVRTYLPRIEMREIIKELRQPNIYPCVTPYPDKR